MLRKVFHMMPFMHLRIVENVFEKAKLHFYIRMIEMPDADCYQVNKEEILDAKTYHPQRNIFQRPVYNCFHPMKPQVRSKTKLFGRMMHLVKLPQPWYAVK